MSFTAKRRIGTSGLSLAIVSLLLPESAHECKIPLCRIRPKFVEGRVVAESELKVGTTVSVQGGNWIVLRIGPDGDLQAGYAECRFGNMEKVWPIAALNSPGSTVPQVFTPKVQY